MNRVKQTRKVFGVSPFLWIGVAMVIAPLVTVAEMGLAITLQGILANLGNLSGALPAVPFASTLASSIYVAAGTFCAFGILRAALQLAIGWAAGVTELAAKARLRQLALGQLMWEANDGPTPASQQFWIETILPKAALYLNRVALLLPQIVVTIGLLIGMAFIDVPMTLIALALVTCLGLLVRRLGDGVNRATRKHLGPLAELLTGIGRVRRNWIFVTIMGAKQLEYRRLSSLNEQSTSYAMRAHWGAVAAGILPEIGGILVLGALLVAQERLRIGERGLFLQFVYLLTRVVQSLTKVAELFGSIWQNKSSFHEALQNFSKLDEDRIARTTESSPSKLTARLESTALPSVELRNVSFSYEGSKEVLSHINFRIGAGEQIGLVGPSGSGKSTLIALILGLQDPTHGRVLVDGTDPHGYFEREKSAVGYVGAEPFLIGGSIRENLAYGQERSYTSGDYETALEQARLTHVVSRLRGGLDYPITENGEGLSAGEKQRLALARALLRRPRLLILDELTANLDQATEREIAMSLRSIKGTCTCLIVSHRMGILLFADRVLDLDRPALERATGPLQESLA